MAVAIRHSRGAQGSGTDSTTTPTFTVDPVTGDTMVVFVTCYTSETAPTDTPTNTIAQLGTTQVNSASDRLSMWACQNMTGGSSYAVTAHGSGSGIQDVTAAALSGVATASYNSDFKGATGSSTNPTTGTAGVTPAAGSMHLAAAATDNSWGGATPGAGASWTLIPNNNFQSGSSYATQVCESRLSDSDVAGTFLNSTMPWAALKASFMPPSASTGGKVFTGRALDSVALGGRTFGHHDARWWDEYRRAYDRRQQEILRYGVESLRLTGPFVMDSKGNIFLELGSVALPRRMPLRSAA